MRTILGITGAYALFSIGMAIGKVSGPMIEQRVQAFRQNLKTELDIFICADDDKKVETINSLLPPGPKDKDKDIEKDVFAGTVEENDAAVEILKEVKDRLETKIEKVDKLLRSQKSIQRRWKRFWRRS